MSKVIFPEPRTCEKYDDNTVLGYINEEVINDYVPDTPDQEHKPDPITAYQYDEIFIDSPDLSRDNLVNGIIRQTYSATQEFAMIHHHLNDPDTYADEWKQYNAVRDNAKKEVARWLEK